MTSDRYLPLRELAEITGISSPRLRAAAAQRAFPTVRLSGQGRYHARLADVRAWLASLTVPAVSRPSAGAMPGADLLPPGAALEERLL